MRRGEKPQTPCVRSNWKLGRGELWNTLILNLDREVWQPGDEITVTVKLIRPKRGRRQERER